MNPYEEENVAAEDAEMPEEEPMEKEETMEEEEEETKEEETKEEEAKEEEDEEDDMAPEEGEDEEEMEPDYYVAHFVEMKDQFEQKSPRILRSIVDAMRAECDRVLGEGLTPRTPTLLQKFLGVPEDNDEPLSGIRVKSISLSFGLALTKLNLACHKKGLLGNSSEDTLDTENSLKKLQQSMRVASDLLDATYRMARLSQNEFDTTRSDFVNEDDPDLTGTDKVKLFLLNQIQHLSYRRHGKNCYAPMQVSVFQTRDGTFFYEDDNPWDVKPQDAGTTRTAFTFRTGAWYEIKTIESCIRELTRKEDQWEQWKRVKQNVTTLAADLEKCVDPEFPELKLDRDARSFLNGVLIMEPHKSRFDPYNPLNTTKNDIAVARHFSQYFESNDWLIAPTEPNPMQWWFIPTPWFDRVLIDQQISPLARSIVYAMFGRMLFQLNRFDHHQVTFLILGLGNTGKSAAGKACANFFHPSRVANLSANLEEKFGLGPVVDDKDWYVCWELTSTHGLNSADMRLLVEGTEFMSIATKFQNADTNKAVQIPGLWLGNELGPWADVGNSITRRLVTLEFPKEVLQIITQMDNLLAEETPAMIYKCFKAYEFLLKTHPNQNLWSFIPKYYRDVRQKIATRLNPIREFVLNTEKLLFQKDNKDLRILFSDFTVLLKAFLHNNLQEKKMPSTHEIEDVLHGLGLQIDLSASFVSDGNAVQGKCIVGLGHTTDLEVQKRLHQEAAKIVGQQDHEFEESLHSGFHEHHHGTRTLCECV